MQVGPQVAEAVAPKSGSAGHRIRTMSLAVAALLLLAAMGWLVHYRATYGTFAWWKIPPRIGYCGRDYNRGATISALPTQNWTFTQVRDIQPSGWRVYSKQPKGVASGSAAPVAGLPCTMGLVLKESDNEFVQYGLSGGP